MIAPDFSSFFNQKEYSDLTLHVGSGGVYFVHKIVLCGFSKYFKALCYGGFAESGASEVSIEEEDELSFNIILRCMYGESLEHLIDFKAPHEDRINTLLNILTLVDKYDVSGLGDELSFLFSPILHVGDPTFETAIKTVYALSEASTKAIRRVIALKCHEEMEHILSKEEQLALLISQNSDLSFAMLKLENSKGSRKGLEMQIPCPRCKVDPIAGAWRPYLSLSDGRCSECYATFSPVVFAPQLVLKEDQR